MKGKTKMILTDKDGYVYYFNEQNELVGWIPPKKKENEHDTK